LYWNNTNNRWDKNSTILHIGKNSGNVNQYTNSIAIGYESGNLNQGTNSISIGYQAGNQSKLQDSVSIGTRSGQNQSIASIAIGYESGKLNQESQTIAIGYQAGNNSQKKFSTAIGKSSGLNNLPSDSICIGAYTNADTKPQSVVLGINGYSSIQSVGIFSKNDENSLGPFSVSINGKASANIGGFESNVLIGRKSYLSGSENTIISCPPIDRNYELNSKNVCVCIGNELIPTINCGSSVLLYTGLSRRLTLSNNCVMLSTYYDQNITNTLSNTIILGNTGRIVPKVSSLPGLYMDFLTSTNYFIYVNGLHDKFCISHNYTSKLTGLDDPNYGKTFVIQHPEYESKYLIHSCLEGPEIGVYYRGESEVTNKYITIKLPTYVDKISEEVTVFTTPIQDSEKIVTILSVSVVNNNSFKVYSKNPCKFFWVALCKRKKLAVEVNKQNIYGFGPYTYL